MPRIQHKRGLKANLPTSGNLVGETFFTTDENTLHFADSPTSTVPIVPAVEDLTTLAAVDGTADLLLIHDADETGARKGKKITVNAFRTALNIPVASTDELVAVVAGGTSGYLYGTDGTDGVLRLNSSLAYTLDAGNGFVTIAVNDIDLGTF